MMFNNLGLYSPRRFLRRLRPSLQPIVPIGGQIGGCGNDIFYNGGSEGPSGPPGADGVSVTNAYVSENPGDLFITLSDGTVINAGNVVGPQGPEGPPGSCSLVAVILVDVDYTALSTDYYIGATKKNINITLPLGVTGKVYVIKNQADGNVKVAGTAGQKLDSDNFKSLGAESTITCVFDGTRWNII